MHQGEGKETEDDDSSPLMKSRARRSGYHDQYENSTAKYLRDLDPTQPLHQRISATYKICEEIELFPAEAIVDICTVSEDLTQQSAPLEARKAGLALLRACAARPSSPEGRKQLYSLIVNYSPPNESSIQISALADLTRHGKDLSPFEAQITEFLNSSLEALSQAAKRARERQHEEIKSKDRPTKGSLGIGHGDMSTLGRTKTLPEEVKSLRETFYLIADIITQNPSAFSDVQLQVLVERIASITRNATSKKDLHGVAKILQAITVHAWVPTSILGPCIRVLCIIYGIPTISLDEELWVCFVKLLQIESRNATTDVLLDILTTPSIKSGANEIICMVRGSLFTFARIAEDCELGQSLIGNIQRLARALDYVHTKQGLLEHDVLATVNSLLCNDKLLRSLISEDWGILSDKLAAINTARDLRVADIYIDQKIEHSVSSSGIPRMVLSNEGGNRRLSQAVTKELSRMAECVIFAVPSYWESLPREKFILIVRTLVNIAFYVPSAWGNAAHLMWEHDLLLPSDKDWTRHLRMLFDEVLADPAKPEGPRCSILHVCCKLFTRLRLDRENKTILEAYLRKICESLALQQGLPTSLVESVGELAASCGPDIGNDTFDAFLSVIEAASKPPLSDAVTSAGLSERTVDCLIKIFLRCLPQSATKTCHIYKILLRAAEPTMPANIRIRVMKLLTRLRCDSREAIEVTMVADTQGLASALGRTTSTACSVSAEQSPSNRSSMHDQPQLVRQSRSSAVDIARPVRSRSTTRSANLKEEYSLSKPPLWMYDGSTKGLPEDPRKGPSQVVYSSPMSQTHPVIIDIGSWLDIVIDVLDKDGDWEIYSYILVHLPSQLSNRTLCARHVRQLQTLHNLLVNQLEKGSFHQPPRYTRMKMADVALCLYHILTMLVSYNETFGRRELDNAVRTFLAGISKWDRAGKCCIHALALCCQEIPSVVDRYIFAIIQKMSQKITQSDLAVDILEFLGDLSRLTNACASATKKLPENHSSAGGNDGTFFKKVFGICISYIQSTREQRLRPAEDYQEGASPALHRQGGMAVPDAHAEMRGGFSAYVYTLAYHVIIFWFLSIDLTQRAQHVGWVAKELTWKDNAGREVLEEQSQVILDMMHRTAYSNLGETKSHPDFVNPEEAPIKKTWLLGMSIVTVEILPSKGTGQFTKRQASGTTHALYYHNTASIPEHYVQDHNNASGLLSTEVVDVYPNHMFLQLSSTIAPVPIPLQPVVLPDDDFTRRALRNFDRTDTVDGHKVGVIYVGEGQTLEADILANSRGTEAYETLLSGLGTAVQLRGAKFNTQGLDRESDIDGTQTYAWRDRVTEMVFHVATMMPTDSKNDPQGNNKKRHIGNDPVKIIYNNSGQDFKFDTITSAFNDVNIVITPEAHTREGRISKRRKSQQEKGQDLSAEDLFGFYKVQTLVSPEFPSLSPAFVPKIVSASVLPAFVRQIALNASVFAQIWSETLGHGKYVSTWLTRLQEINRLRARYGNTQTSANLSYPMPASAPTYVEGSEYTGRVAMGGMAERDQLLMGLDFTRWT